MDYTLSRRDDLLIKKLSFPGLFPIGELSGTLSNGTVSGSDSSTIKWQCSFNYVGDDLQDGDTIAIYAVLVQNLYKFVKGCYQYTSLNNSQHYTQVQLSILYMLYHNS